MPRVSSNQENAAGIQTLCTSLARCRMIAVMGRSIRTTGIILKNYRVAEYHKGLIILSPDLGIFHATAFGAFKGKSKLSGVSEAFTDASFLLYHDPVKDRYKITEIVPERVHGGLRGNLEAYYTALFWSELLMKSFAGGGEFRRLFDFIREGFGLLDTKKNHELINLQFMWRYLDLIGFQPDLHNCDECMRPVHREEALFLLGDRFLCNNCLGISPGLRLSPAARNYLLYTSTLPFFRTLGVDLPEGERGSLMKLLYALIEEVVGVRLNTLQKGLV